MAEVIAFEAIVRQRRQRVARAIHARCLVILVDSVTVARAAVADASPSERRACIARLRKLEELAEWAHALG